jgi:hypothetical protein
MSTTQTNTSPVLTVARNWRGLGCSVVPVKPDGSKRPAVREWSCFRDEPADNDILQHWFKNGQSGIGVITGLRHGQDESGKPVYLEVLDFDDRQGGYYAQFLSCVALAETAGRLPVGLFKSLVHVLTPGPGHQYWWRCTEVSGAQELAFVRAADPQDPFIKVVETRGVGSYVVAVGSPATVHKNKVLYRLAPGSPNFANIPIISPEERAILLDLTKLLDERDDDGQADSSELYVPSDTSNWRWQVRPIDDYVSQLAWSEILEPHGWHEISPGRWRRPGSFSATHHATSNHAGRNLFHVFTTNGTVFNSGKSYSKARAFVLLNFDGDYFGAAMYLADRGFGVPAQPNQ